MEDGAKSTVVIVGGGFAGIGCALKLVKEDPDLEVTLLDRNAYHQFQPLLYQVATSQLSATDIAYPLREMARKFPNLRVKVAEVASIDPAARTVTTVDGFTYGGDYLVLAAGSQPFFFGTPGANEHAFPLYSLEDAVRLRARVIELFEEADRDPAVIYQGALRFVVVGGGPTGVEVAGALSEMIDGPLANEFHELAVGRAKVTLVDHGNALLRMFSHDAHDYTAKVLHRDGVELRLGTGVSEVGPGHVTFDDGARLATRCVIWGGGLQAAPVAGTSGLPRGRGGRIDVRPDLTVEDSRNVFVVGDIANIPSPDGTTFPQLGSVAMQTGSHAATNILRLMDGEQPLPFHYLDKGTMAMIGRGSAIAVIPFGHHELHGSVAFAAWLGVHAALMSGYRNRINAFVDWGWDYFSKGRGPQMLDRRESARIDWGDDPLAADELPSGGAGAAAS